jgi:hypothetical protein
VTRTGSHLVRKRFRRTRRLSVEAMERRAKIVEHGREVTVQGGTAPDQYIIMVRPHRYEVDPFYQFAEPPPDAVPLGGGAILLGDREPKADRTIVVAQAALQHKGSAVCPCAIGNGEEVRPLP